MTMDRITEYTFGLIDTVSGDATLNGDNIAYSTGDMGFFYLIIHWKKQTLAKIS